jgi:hypothetical protein
MVNEPDDFLRQSFIDGSYSFNGGVLKISPNVFQGPDSAQHVRVLIEASKAGIPTEIPEAPSPSLPPVEDGERLLVHRIDLRPNTNGRIRPVLIVGFATPR